MAVRVHLMIPEEMLREIDELAGPRHRSEFIVGVLEQYVANRRMRQVLDETAGILDPANYPEWSTPERIDEWVRQQRKQDVERLEAIIDRRTSVAP